MIYVKTRRPTSAPRRGLARRAAQTAVVALAWLAGVGAGVGAGPAQAQAQAQRLEAITLNAGMHNIRAELAATPQQRQIGLMHRRDLGPNDGMLFVFEQASPQCFWMKNTPTPLTIAFLDDDGAIVNLADMKPFDEASHCSAKPVRYVLEMHQGWFAKRGLKSGFKLGGAPFKR